MRSRYDFFRTYGFNSFRGYSNVSYLIRTAIENGTLDYTSSVLRGFQRLDNIAGEHYGDGRLWWIIAAASGIGWGLQVPPGTVLNIPNSDQVFNLLS